MEPIVILGSLSSNRDPLKRIQVFEMVPAAYTSMEEAIRAAKEHFRLNFAQGVVPQFRVYQATDPDGTEYAFVEVTGSTDMTFVSLYKIIAGKYGWLTPPERTESQEASNPLLGSGTMPPPSGIPPPELPIRQRSG